MSCLTLAVKTAASAPVCVILSSETEKAPTVHGLLVMLLTVAALPRRWPGTSMTKLSSSSSSKCLPSLFLNASSAPFSIANNLSLVGGPGGGLGALAPAGGALLTPDPPHAAKRAEVIAVIMNKVIFFMVYLPGRLVLSRFEKKKARRLLDRKSV